MLQRVAVCCSVLQRVLLDDDDIWLVDEVLPDVVCCSVLQCVAVCSSVLQCAARCSVSQ